MRKTSIWMSTILLAFSILSTTACGSGSNKQLVEADASSESTAAQQAEPTVNDAMTEAYTIPGFEPAVTLSYPSSLEAKAEIRNGVYLDTPNTPPAFYGAHGITVCLMKTGEIDEYFNYGYERAQDGLIEVTSKIIEGIFPERFLSCEESVSTDAGTFYDYAAKIQVKSILSNETKPQNAIVNVRYYGPIGYMLVGIFTADEDEMDTYYQLGTKILNSVSIGGDWSTAVKAGPVGGRMDMESALLNEIANKAAASGANVQKATQTTQALPKSVPVSSGGTESYYYYDAEGDI